jgi:formiminotetrahydrofolate cyclodeaminase
MLIEKSVKGFVYEVKSDSPTPGGGSVSALAGSLGAALSNMVGNLTIGKGKYEEIPEEKRALLEVNQEKLSFLIDDLLSIIDEDSTAFDDVMKAFKLPKSTEEEKQIRSEKIQLGYKKALEVPLKCAQKCLETLNLQKVFAEYGNVNAITDVGVGTLLAYSGLEGALFNVTINLKSIKDEEYREKIEKAVKESLEKGKELKEEILGIVYKRLS